MATRELFAQQLINIESENVRITAQATNVVSPSNNFTTFRFNNHRVLTDLDLLTDVTIGNILVGVDPNGQTFVAGVLHGQYANTTSPGMVDGAGNQSFGGVKSFQDLQISSPGGKMTYGAPGTPLLQVGSNVLPSLYEGLNSGVDLTAAANTIYGNNSMTVSNTGTENAGFGYGTFANASGTTSHNTGVGCSTLQQVTSLAERLPLLLGILELELLILSISKQELTTVELVSVWVKT
jgi:hypothetical protein